MAWTINYDNGTGPGDEGFWEWWEVLDENGEIVAKCFSEKDAKRLVAFPELIEACDAMLFTYAPNAEQTAQRDGEEALLSCVRMARDAIAKATLRND